MDKNAESAKISQEALMIRINAMCYWTFKSVKHTTISPGIIIRISDLEMPD